MLTSKQSPLSSVKAMASTGEQILLNTCQQDVQLVWFSFFVFVFFPPVSSAVKVFGWSRNLRTFAAQRGGADSEGWGMLMLLEGAGGASNDSRDHSCEHLTFPLPGAAQVGRPDCTTLFRGR